MPRGRCWPWPIQYYSPIYLRDEAHCVLVVFGRQGRKSGVTRRCSSVNTHPRLHKPNSTTHIETGCVAQWQGACLRPVCLFLTIILERFHLALTSSIPNLTNNDLDHIGLWPSQEEYHGLHRILRAARRQSDPSARLEQKHYNASAQLHGGQTLAQAYSRASSPGHEHLLHLWRRILPSLWDKPAGKLGTSSPRDSARSTYSSGLGNTVPSRCSV